MRDSRVCVTWVTWPGFNFFEIFLIECLAAGCKSTYAWVILHLWVSCVMYMSESCPNMTESCRTESCCAYDWVMLCVWMIHVTHSVVQRVAKWSKEDRFTWCLCQCVVVCCSVLQCVAACCNVVKVDWFNRLHVQTHDRMFKSTTFMCIYTCACITTYTHTFIWYYMSYVHMFACMYLSMCMHTNHI